jgi:uncharacterized membrane protein YjjP (DUF1212 family)
MVHVATVLLECGCPSYRVEGAVRAIGALEGYQADGFALPTAIFLNVLPPKREDGSDATPVHRMTRVREWQLDLAKLTEVDAIFNRVAQGKLGLEEAHVALERVRHDPNPYPRAQRWLAVGGAGAAASIFFRGGLVDEAVSTVIGLLLYGMGRLVSRNGAARYLQDFLYAFVATLLAHAASRVFPGASREAIVLAAIVSRVPGMTLTTGLAEIAQKNLVSGGARLMEALVTLLSLALGIAVVVAFGKGAVAVDFSSAERVPLGLPYQLAALVVASLSFAVIFAVPPRHLWSALVSGAVGYTASAVALKTMPLHVAAFVASACVCIFANAMARKTDRPAQLYQVPGMMLLVPGTFGFLSFADLVGGHFVDGAARGFEVLLVAGGLVIGVIGANAVVHPRKIL